MAKGRYCPATAGLVVNGDEAEDDGQSFISLLGVLFLNGYYSVSYTYF